MQLIAAASVLFSGLLAGTEIAVRLGVAGPLELLDDRSHVIMRQGLIRTFRVIAPSFYFPALLSSIGALVLVGPVPARIAGVAALGVWAVATFAGTVPINVAAIEWDPLKPPADFRAIIQRWERLALVRVAVALVAFGAFTIAA